MTASALPSRPLKMAGLNLQISFGMRAVARLEEIYDGPIKRVAKRFQPVPVLDDDDRPVMIPATDPQGREIVPRQMIPAMAPEVRVADLQRILWASLAEHHPEFDLEQVMDLLETELKASGALDGVLSTTLGAFGAAGDRPPPGEGAGQGGNPPDPQSGATVSPSTLTA